MTQISWRFNFYKLELIQTYLFFAALINLIAGKGGNKRNRGFLMLASRISRDSCDMLGGELYIVVQGAITAQG